MILVLLIGLAACIGTDVVDYPLGAPPSHAEISEGSLSLAAQETLQLNFRLVANNGTTLPATWEWSSRDDNIASVDENGVVTGIAKGQTRVIGIAEVEFADSVLVTVTSDPDDVASVVIQGDDSNMELGEVRQLNATVRTAGGDILDVPVSWVSSDMNVVSVDQTGQIAAQAEGTASITASAQDILSEPFDIEVGDEDSESRSGVFSGRNGYNASGTAILVVEGNEALLRFSSDFSTQSGPGLYIYLSPVDNGITGALELGEIQSTAGAQEYMLPAGSNPDLYDHVIIYCKPFGVLFGVASLE